MNDDQAPRLESIHLAGSPRAMGQAFGEACRDDTQQLYHTRLDAAIEFARRHGRRLEPEPILDLAQQCLNITQAYDPVGYEEFLGIARGAELSPQQLFITQGLTDLRDILAFSDPTPATAAANINANANGDDPGREGCSAIILPPHRAENQHTILAQTWDLATSNMPFVRLVHRKPLDAPATVSLTLTGCLTLIGLNSEGLAVGNTNLHTRDSRVGLQYLTVLHRAIRCRTVADAEPTIANAPRSAAHYYYIADATGHAVALECSATRCHRFTIGAEPFVHCNHCLAPPIAELEAPGNHDSTRFRQQRLTDQLHARRDALTIDDARALLCDREGGDLAICRYCTGPYDVSTNAAVIMRPQTGELHACRAQPDRGLWQTCHVN